MTPADTVLAHTAVYALCKRIAEAVEGAVPPGFRGKLTVDVDLGKVLPHNVTIQVRPPQPKPM